MHYSPGAYLIGPYLRLHGAAYRLSGGAVGKHVGGRPALLLHTVGRRTGRARTNALVYVMDGDRYVVVASNGGAPAHPGWFFNLRATPDVEVQVGRRRQPAHARIVEGPERDRLWRLVNERNRGLAPVLHRDATGRYDVYQRHTDRQIPVVVLEPAEPADRPNP